MKGKTIFRHFAPFKALGIAKPMYCCPFIACSLCNSQGGINMATSAARHHQNRFAGKALYNKLSRFA